MKRKLCFTIIVLIIALSVVLLTTTGCDDKPRTVDVGDLLYYYLITVVDEYSGIAKTYKLGSLDEIPESPVELDMTAGFNEGMASPDNSHFICLSGAYFDRITSFLIDQNTGALISSDVMTATSYNGILCYSSDSAYLFGTGGTPFNGLGVFSINDATGVLTLEHEYTAGTTSTNLNELAATPDGKFLYAADSGENLIYGFSYDDSDGSLTPLTPASFSPGADVEPDGILVNPDSTFLYCNTEEGMKILSINSTTGALTPVAYTPELTPGDLYQWNIHPDGEYMIASSYHTINIYSIDTSTGIITDTDNSIITTENDNFRCDTMSPDGRYLFAIACATEYNGGDKIAVYEFDASTGTVTEQDDSPYLLGDVVEWAFLAAYTIPYQEE